VVGGKKGMKEGGFRRLSVTNYNRVFGLITTQALETCGELWFSSLEFAPAYTKST
jgi:hypothetical protein